MAARERKLTWTLILTVFATCFGSTFLIGYNMAVTNLPGENIKKFFVLAFMNTTFEEAEKRTLNPNFYYSVLNAVYIAFGAIGAFSSGWVAEYIGRRNGIIVNSVIAIVGGTICAPCVRYASVTLLFVGRALLGINSGISIGVASLYLMEFAPREFRGAIGACNQLAITIGIVTAYFATLKYTLNKVTLWPIAILLNIIPASTSIVILPFLPESPRFLFLRKKNEEGARKAFTRFNAKEDVETFLGELREELEVAKSQPAFRFIQLFKQRDLMMPVLIACLIQIMQQLSGINAVISYSAIMLRAASISDTYQDYCVTVIGVINVIVTIISMPLLERVGRRTLLLWPSVVVAATLFLLTITVSVATAHPETYLATIMSIISVILILLYICGFAMGLGPIPSIIVSEIFRQGPRAAAYSLSQSLQWLTNLLVVLTYPKMSEAIRGYSFVPFCIVVVICWTFFFLFMPETKNRTFDEVARDLAFGNIVVGKRTAVFEDRQMAVFTKDRPGQNTSNVEHGTTSPLLHPTSREAY